MKSVNYVMSQLKLRIISQSIVPDWLNLYTASSSVKCDNKIYMILAKQGRIECPNLKEIRSVEIVIHNYGYFLRLHTLNL